MSNTRKVCPDSSIVPNPRELNPTDGSRNLYDQKFSIGIIRLSRFVSSVMQFRSFLLIFLLLYAGAIFLRGLSQYAAYKIA
jgi:hypothetical protein